MTWSTRGLAELAGTTVKSVRHYHSVGLLEEPGRAANGYKHYGTPHLVRLLQITLLRNLGMSLADIAEAGEADEDFNALAPDADDDTVSAVAAPSTRTAIASIPSIRHPRRHARRRRFSRPPARLGELPTPSAEIDRKAVIAVQVGGRTAARQASEVGWASTRAVRL
ncbi:MerR family transcriptional regulator [Brachybacterium subflavum]|uniref:MerR family transcriptional regulator n=1 Tax=Brachybacterium subflavum TaxID=2585206 RepID=UPI00126638C6|nr:MerR family transcriptional regulator [Brachybacterium subflavum]